MDQGEKLKMTGKELEAEIVELLNRLSTTSGGKRTKPGCNMNHGQACCLGTCVDNEPRVTPVDFFNEGMTIWIAGEPGGKIANIMRNPKVSVGIYEPVDHAAEQKSLQIFGTAEIINIKNNPQEFDRKIDEFGMNEAGMGVIEEFVQFGAVPKGQEKEFHEKAMKRFNLIKIKPEKVVMLHMAPGKPPLKKIWEKGEAIVKSPLG